MSFAAKLTYKAAGDKSENLRQQEVFQYHQIYAINNIKYSFFQSTTCFGKLQKSDMTTGKVLQIHVHFIQVGKLFIGTRIYTVN